MSKTLMHAAERMAPQPPLYDQAVLEDADNVSDGSALIAPNARFSLNRLAAPYPSPSSGYCTGLCSMTGGWSVSTLSGAEGPVKVTFRVCCRAVLSFGRQSHVAPTFQNYLKMNRDVWYLLVDERGQPAFDDVGADSVSFGSDVNVLVTHLRKKVWEENKDDLLYRVSAVRLRVYSNKDNIADPAMALKASALVGD
ncbi:hypothetical protein CcCBS67573_g10519, partial [Chytriomyces confervae]